MVLSDDLIKQVNNIFKGTWNIKNGVVVPTTQGLILNDTNEGVELEATVLYADIDGSTSMVDSYTSTFAAEVYKAYLACAGKIIRDAKGEITAYDGDRIMAIFIGGSKNTTATRTALNINYAVNNIINPRIKAQYPQTTFVLKQVVGIDTSKLLVVRTGVRGANDLVWVGRAANYAAKLAALPADFATNITKDVYDCLAKESKYADNGVDMWTLNTWTAMNKIPIYRSNYYRAI